MPRDDQETKAERGRSKARARVQEITESQRIRSACSRTANGHNMHTQQFSV